MCQVNEWETLSLQLIFVFFDKRGLAGPSYNKEKENYNPLNYFRMGIIEMISFFFFDVEDPARCQKLWTGMIRKLKNKVHGLR